MDDRAQQWFKRAHSCGIRGEGWFPVKAGSPEHKEWLAYFGKLGWVPWVVRNVDQLKDKSYTMPVQWPGWLPAGFSEALV